MLAYFGALETPAFPIAAIPAPALIDARGAALDELDTLIAEYDAALAERDEAARRVTIIEQRIALVRLALAGQTTLIG